MPLTVIAELVAALTVALFAAGIGVTFLVADRESPTSRALALMLGLMGSILFLSGLRRADLVPEVPEVWERLGAVLEAGSMVAAVEWVLRIGRTAAAPAPRSSDPPLRIAQLLLAFHGLFGLLFIEIRIRYAHGDWPIAVLGEPGFHAFVGPMALGFGIAMRRMAEVLRSDIDEAERIRLRALAFAAPFLLSGIPLQPPLEYLPTAFGEILFLSGSVRYLVVQGRRGQFLERFLSPQVARLVRERGLASAMSHRRVELSVVACDLRGFTAFSEASTPERVMELLREYYDAVGAAVGECGGTIKDFAGDGVLTLVGAPIEYPDHARRAATLALRLRQRGGEVLERWKRPGFDLGIGIGVASGTVTVGAIGGAERLEYAAVGSAVNLAARLCNQAAAGQVLVEARVASTIGTGGSFRFEPLEPISLKGYSQPVPVARLVV